MKYENIVMIGKNGSTFKFVKYSDEYEKLLSEFNNPNIKILSCVKSFPTTYSELSEEQSYLILNIIDRCIGIIFIGTSCDEKDLEIKIQLDETKFSSARELCFITDEIVDRLGYCFRDKDYIEVILANNINLCDFSSKYLRKVYDSNLTTFIFPNTLNGQKQIRLYENSEQTETRKGKKWYPELWEPIQINFGEQHNDAVKTEYGWLANPVKGRTTSDEEEPESSYDKQLRLIRSKPHQKV